MVRPYNWVSSIYRWNHFRLNLERNFGTQYFNVAWESRMANPDGNYMDDSSDDDFGSEGVGPSNAQENKAKEYSDDDYEEDTEKDPKDESVGDN